MAAITSAEIDLPLDTKPEKQVMVHEEKIPEEKASPISSVSSPEVTNRQSLAFGKAAIAFKDRLTSVRRKHDSAKTLIDSPASDLEADKENKDVDTEDGLEDKRQKPVRILRAVQGLLTSIISIIIAFLQGRVYITYLNTKNDPGAWPKAPMLLPTLMLFLVAICAFVFDLCLVVTYLTRNKKYARVAYNIANKSHYIITSVKAVSYALTAAVCRSGFNYGNSSQNHNDLWSWTCCQKSVSEGSVIQASSNCTSQTVAWTFAILNAIIESIGALIQVIIAQQKASAAAKQVATVSSPVEQHGKLDELYDDIGSNLKELTPNTDN